MKKIGSLFLSLILLMSALSFASAEETRVFTDSTGRAVEVPARITRVAITGPLTQYPVFALAPEMLIAISTAWGNSAVRFLPEEYLALPNIGQLYGGKGEMNLEELLLAAPDVVIDVGETKGSIAEDLDKLTALTGIPFVHIDASLSTFGDTFLMLGDLLGKEEEAKALSDFCVNTYRLVSAIAASAEKVKLLYVTGSEGLNVIAANCYQSEVIDLLSDNLAVVDNPSSKGTGNETDMEQILKWNPDFVIFSPDSIFGTVAEDEIWKNVTAIRNDAFVEVPFGPQNWMGFPPGCQRMLGLLWMAKMLYPEAADYDLFKEVSTYYRLFYHCDLTREQYDTLMMNSIGKTLK